MNTNQNPINVALNYFNAWQQNDFEKASSMLSNEITFEMPINSYSTKQEFMQAVQFTALAAQEVVLLAQLGNDEEAVLIYTLILKGLTPLQICEHFKVKDDKIIFIRHIHDTYELRIAGFDKT